MLSTARLRHGAKIICGARVVDLIMAGERVTGVRVADGTQYEADTVVNCAGRWTNEATRDAGLHLPLAPDRGVPGVYAASRRRFESGGAHNRGRRTPRWRGTPDAALEPNRRESKLRHPAQSGDAGS